MEKTPQERYLEKHYMGSSHDWAFKQLADVSGDEVVLDIGPGSGVMGKFLREHGCTELYAVEIDKGAQEYVTPYYNEVKTYIEEFQGRKFTLIIVMDVLEHMTNPFEYLQKLMDFLEPGGRIVISLPNVAHWSVRIPLLFGIMNFYDRGILDRTHYTWFTRKRVRELVNSVPELSYKEINSSIEPAEFVLPDWMTQNAAFKFCSKVRIATAQILPGFFAYQHLVIATKK